MLNPLMIRSEVSEPIMNITASTDAPEMVPDIQKTVLVLVPCIFLWVLTPLEIKFLINSKDRLVPWSWVNVTKILASLILLVVEGAEFIYTVTQLDTSILEWGDYLKPSLLFATFVLQLTLVLVGKKRGIQSSGILFLFWLILLVCAIPEYYSLFKNFNDPGIENDMMLFSLYMVYFPFIVLAFFVNCFGDSRPQYLEHPRGKNVSPELDSSFLSQLTFSWIDGLIWKGYKRPLTQDDMYDLVYNNSVKSVAKSWDKSWDKTAAKIEKKSSKYASASYSSNRASVELSGKGSNKPQISVLPILVRTFGPALLVNALLKVVHDMLQFVAPQILDLIIGFARDKGTDNPQPLWNGIAYAVLMLVTTEVQSLFLSQYFAQNYVIGMKIRAGIISAVYRKSLRVSSSGRKVSSMGEIVNLMSVDAGILMGLIPYINMIWSAPLQIALTLYFQYEILGPAVFAGLAVMVISIPLNGVIATVMKKLQMTQMKAKDKRVKLMSEILNGMKVLKLYAWEPSFEDNVEKVRGDEVKVLKKSAYLGALSSVIFTFIPFLVLFSMFTTYVLISPDNHLDANKIFVSISLMNIMRMPMTMLPMLLVFFTQALVSLKRMAKFMNAEEIDPEAVVKDTDDKSTGEPLVVENGTFSWGNTDDDKEILKNININIKSGSLNAVVGSVGAGKSSLCSAFLGEMEKNNGSVSVNGSLAYVAQQPWIQNCTLEDNILFSKDKDENRYKAVVQACALQADLEMLPAGDQTEIGEKGINLSGGQKQRVSLARAVYNDADIYILDDPLSAVDSHVGKHIFEQVIGPNGILKSKTKLLVTHGLTYLPHMDHIIVIKDGQVSEQGSYQTLLENKGEFQEFLLQHLAEQGDTDEPELGDIKSQLEATLGREKLQTQISQVSKSDSEKDSSKEIKKGQPEDANSKKSIDGKKGQKLIEKEESKTGKVTWSIYGSYFKAIGGLSAFLTLFTYFLGMASSVGTKLWLTQWSTVDYSNMTDNEYVDSRNLYLGVYAGFGVLQGLTVFVGTLIFAQGTIRASKKLHSSMLHNIMRSPMSFFDVTPLGRIVNRFSGDLQNVDSGLPGVFRGWIQCFLAVLATFVSIIGATPIFVVVLIPVLIIYYFVQVLYVASSRQLKRIGSVTNSPIYSHFQETLHGVSTIRAFNLEEEFTLASEKKTDLNNACSYPGIMANRWLAVRLDFVGNFMIFFAALFAVLGSVSDAIVGFSLSYAMSATGVLNWMVRCSAEVETNIVAVERIKEYSETPQEAQWIVPNKTPHKDWPANGVVKFNNYSTRYREGLDLVVKGIDCEIHSGEKIGIVGRTGAGKSSLTLALFRIIEAAGGNIEIDGQDLASMGLHHVRGRLTIIPQDPVLFSGTLRMNLDPFNTYSDEVIWLALEHAHLKNFVTELTTGLQHEVSEGGENLSVGQRQLVCLARALLRKTRILVLDEATAAVDVETDDLIQKTIRQEFADCTVITIAHRLNTIMDSTRVLVMGKGEIIEFDTPSVLLKQKDSIFYGMAKDAGLV